MFILSFSLYLTICAFLVIYYAKREGLISSALVFIAGATIYYVAIPTELFLLNSQGYFSSAIGSFIEVTDSRKMIIILMASCSILSFLSGYRLSRFNPRISHSSSFPFCKIGTKSSLLFTVFKVISIATLISLTLFFRKELISSFSYSGNVYQTYQNSIFSFIKYQFFIAATVCCCLYLVEYKKIKLGLIIGFLVILFGLLTFDKNPILMISFALLAWFTQLRFLKSRPLITWFILLFLGCIVLIMLPIFSSYRGGVKIFSIDFVRSFQFSFTRIDPSGPFVSLSKVFEYPITFLFGSSIISDLSVLVPKIFWTNRPFDLSEQFAISMIPDWHPGLGMGYSLMAESFLNFGYLGVIIQYFFVGLLWGITWRISYVLVRSKNIMCALYITYGYYILFLMHRGTILCVVKSLMHVMITLFSFIILVQTISNFCKRIHSGK